MGKVCAVTSGIPSVRVSNTDSARTITRAIARSGVIAILDALDNVKKSSSNLPPSPRWPTVSGTGLTSNYLSASASPPSCNVVELERLLRRRCTSRPAQGGPKDCVPRDAPLASAVLATVGREHASTTWRAVLLGAIRIFQIARVREFAEVRARGPRTF